MNRQQRRKQNRELKKNMNAMRKLPKTQTQMMDIAVKEEAKIIASEYLDSLVPIADSSITAVLLEEGYTWEETYKLQTKIIEYIKEGNRKAIEMRKENIDPMKLEKAFTEEAIKMLEDGVNKKQAIEELMYKFPKMSRSMVISNYERVKKDSKKKITREMIVESAKRYGLDKEGKNKIAKELGSTYSTIATYISRWKVTEEEISDKKETDNAVNKIMDIIDKDSDREEKRKDIPKDKEIEKKEDKHMNENLKVLSMTVEGNNGTYKVCEKGVELQNKGLTMFFENIEQLESFMEEYKQVFKMAK